MNIKNCTKIEIKLPTSWSLGWESSIIWIHINRINDGFFGEKSFLIVGFWAIRKNYTRFENLSILPNFENLEKIPQ